MDEFAAAAEREEFAEKNGVNCAKTKRDEKSSNIHSFTVKVEHSVT